MTEINREAVEVQALLNPDEETRRQLRWWARAKQRDGRVYQIQRQGGARAWLGPGGFAVRASSYFLGTEETWCVWDRYYGADDRRGRKENARRKNLTEDQAIALVARGAWR